MRGSLTLPDPYKRGLPLLFIKRPILVTPPASVSTHLQLITPAIIFTEFQVSTMLFDVLYEISSPLLCSPSPCATEHGLCVALCWGTFPLFAKDIHIHPFWSLSCSIQLHWSSTSYIQVSLNLVRYTCWTCAPTHATPLCLPLSRLLFYIICIHFIFSYSSFYHVMVISSLLIPALHMPESHAILLVCPSSVI